MFLRIFVVIAFLAFSQLAQAQLRFEIQTGQGSGAAGAGEVSVQSGAMAKKVAIGEQGTFVITVNNGKPTNIPDAISADGLQMTLTGQQFMGALGGGQKYVFTYAFFGEKEGEFTVPPMEIDVRGQKFQTNPETITIFKRPPGDAALDSSKPYFSILKTDVTEIYENQMVPYEFIVYARGNSSILEVGTPQVSHNEVVFRKFTEKKIGVRDIDGTLFTTATHPSALFALKEGEHTIGPIQVAARLYESNGFGGRPFFLQSSVKKMVSNSLTLNVKPLPPGAPKSFTGGVGTFELSATASPTNITAGDPISVEFEVNGVGNFETMEAPIFTALNPADWKTYEARKIIDPTEKSDGLNEGRATFSQIVIPQKQADRIPAFELTFFDPAAGQYVTRSTAPIPITVKEDPRRNQPQAAIMSNAAVENGGGETPAADKPEATLNDILTIKPGRAAWRELPMAATSRPIFWIGQAIPSIGLFTLLAVGLLRSMAARSAKKKPAEGEGISFSDAVAAIPPVNSARPDFYRAVKVAIDAWREENPDPDPKALPPETERAVKALDARCDWLLYGAEEAKRSGLVSEREAAETQEILRRLAPLPAAAVKAKARAEKAAKKSDSGSDALGF